MIKCIIPSAGYGTRMNCKLNESKELMIDPVTGKYLIDYSLDLCYKYNIEPIVISRIEKEDLNSYLRSKEVEHIVLKKPGKEWAETVLKSQGLWAEKNILLLPDTRFTPESRFDDIKYQIDHGSKLVLGVHEVPEMSQNKWGIVASNGIYEKPNIKLDQYRGLGTTAWGIIAFRKEIGYNLFSRLSENHQFLWKDDLVNPAIFRLDSFVDITRTGKLEKY